MSDVETLAYAKDVAAKLRAQVARRVVGQTDAVEQLLVALFCNGHALSIGVPGLAKTLLISTLAEAMQLDFARIQFTPDMMPGDVTGSEILEEDRVTGHRSYRFMKGPVFTNILLADELNRTPPKTQAALLQAMAERQVSTAGQTRALPQPFLVLATQNPIEQHGTYPLPEAQLDRFMLAVHVDYPNHDEEVEIVRRTTAGPLPNIVPVLTQADVLRIQALVRQVPVADHLVSYAVGLCRATRPQDEACPAALKPLIDFGASPRASQALILGAKARAVLDGRATPERADVDQMATPVLAHRVVPSFRAEGMDARELIERLLAARR
ncbi:MAG: MoxR family ATPase [Myxococcales bacterium]|nr:MoxR family ATPase [Myxococcales bacterium]